MYCTINKKLKQCYSIYFFRDKDYESTYLMTDPYIFMLVSSPFDRSSLISCNCTLMLVLVYAAHSLLQVKICPRLMKEPQGGGINIWQEGNDYKSPHLTARFPQGPSLPNILTPQNGKNCLADGSDDFY